MTTLVAARPRWLRVATVTLSVLLTSSLVFGTLELALIVFTDVTWEDQLLRPVRANGSLWADALQLLAYVLIVAGFTWLYASDRFPFHVVRVWVLLPLLAFVLAALSSLWAVLMVATTYAALLLPLVPIAALVVAMRQLVLVPRDTAGVAPHLVLAAALLAVSVPAATALRPEAPPLSHVTGSEFVSSSSRAPEWDLGNLGDTPIVVLGARTIGGTADGRVRLLALRLPVGASGAIGPARQLPGLAIPYDESVVVSADLPRRSCTAGTGVVTFEAIEIGYRVRGERFTGRFAAEPPARLRCPAP